MTETPQHTHHGYSPRKADYLRRLKRIEGQARGVARMVDEDEYCIDVLTQISAVRSALQAVAMGLMEDHLEHCVANAAKEGGPEAQEKLDEAMRAIRRLAQ